MNEVYITASIVVLVLVSGILIAMLLRASRRSQYHRVDPDPASPGGKYAEGYWMGIGIGMGLIAGMVLGFGLGLALGNSGLGMAIGPGMGLAIGIAIGAALEQQHKNEIRPLTSEERRARSRMTIVGLVTLAMGVLAFAGLFLARLSD
jgi:ABC-type nickel/cobalt efflux system permease component RcnA